MNLREIISSRVIDEAARLRDVYVSAQPFPHIVIDDFFTSEIAHFLSTEFPAMEQMPTIFREPMSYKGQLSAIDAKWPRFSPIFEALQSAEFRDLVSQITSIDSLLDDKVLAGGGLHQSPKSGFLDIHVDSNFHPIEKHLHRRVNLLVYVSKDWDQQWGGNLNLWSDRNKRPDALVESVPSMFNRAVIFSTTRTSWHGVSPILCPDGISRKSLALYYYTTSRPDDEIYKDSSVIWMNKTVPWKKALYPFMNAVFSVLKPYVSRKNAFDAVKDKANK